MYNKDSFFSKKLLLLNSVLTFLIVLQHSAPLGRFGLDVNIDHSFIYCCIIFSYISVPLFFFMSALLFYRKCEYSDLKRKLSSRVYSLLVPYLLWNTIFVLIYFVITRIPVISEHMRMGVVLNDPVSIIVAILDSRFTPLWFIRDLMCFCLFSPVILFVIKRKWLAALVFVASVFVTNYWDFSHQNVITWIPIYILGAATGRYFTNKESEDAGSTPRELLKSGKSRKAVSAVLILCFVVLYLLSVKDAYYLYWFRLLSPLIIWICLDLLAYAFIKDRFVKREWMGYTFFIYCTHYFVINVIQKLLTFWVAPTELAMNIIFILTPFVTIAILTLCAHFMSRYKFYNYLSGKR